MPNQSNLALNKGIVSSLIFKNKISGDGVARSDAGTLFQHQDFASVQNFVDDRVQLAPTGNPVVKLGDEITFEFLPEADGVTEVDFRCTLPALAAEPGYTYYDENALNTAGRPVFGAPSITTQNKHNVWEGYFDNVQFKTAPAGNFPAQDFQRYRIPNNPGAMFLKDDSDYAVCAGGPCGIEYAGPVIDNLNAFIANACRPPGRWQVAPFGPPTPHGDYEREESFNYPQYDTSQAAQYPYLTYTSIKLSQLVTKSYDVPCPIYCDYVGYWMLERISLTQSVNQIQQFSGEDMFVFDQLFHNNETSAHYAEMAGAWHPDGLGGKWSALDVALCRTQRDIVVPLDFLFWVGKVSQFLPVIALHHPLTMKIKLRSQESCILFERLRYFTPPPGDTSGTRPANDAPTILPVIHSKPIYLTNTCLEIHRFHYPDSHRNANLRELDGPVGQKWKCLDVEPLLNIPISITQKGGVAAEISLLGLRLACTSFIFTKIHAADKGAANANYWTNFLRVNDFQIKAGRDEITPKTDHKYAINRINNLYNNSKLPYYTIYAHHFAKCPMDKFNAWGHMEFGSLHNPVLNLNFARDYTDPLAFYTPTSGAPFRKNTKSTGSPVSNAAADLVVLPNFAPQSDTIGHLVDIRCRVHQQIQIKSGNVQKHFQ